MSRACLFFLWSLFNGIGAQAQDPDEWAWMKGSKSSDQPGNYGTVGVADVANTPGSRRGAAMRADDLGDLWVFGGYGFSAAGEGNLNDLWKYDTATNRWTWIKGSNGDDQPGTYGTQGVSAVANTPGGRESSTTWIDADGRLWLFGGFGRDDDGMVGRLNDLWRYDPADSRWTWIAGSRLRDASGTYGTQGTGAASNIPGARQYAAGWRDAAGHLWLFGGDGEDAAGTDGRLNDLWRYDPSSSEWTWMTGSNAVNQPGIYGTPNVGAPANTPGARTDAVAWLDSSNRLCLFGGLGSPATGPAGLLSDLWRYNVETGLWTWIKGANIISRLGDYGTQGVEDSKNLPGARRGGVGWTDPRGRLWLFGGVGLAATGSTGELNDLWRFNPVTAAWTWIKGSNATGAASVFGTQTVADAANTPGARFGAAACRDFAGDAWLFGGWQLQSGIPHFNNLWRIATEAVPEVHTLPANQIDLTNATLRGNANPSGRSTSARFRYGLKADFSDAAFTPFESLGAGTVSVKLDAVVPGLQPNTLYYVQALASNGLGGSFGEVMTFHTGGAYQWTWMGGTNLANSPGTFGTQGIGSLANIPRAREGAVRWTDAQGDFWLFGGTADLSLGVDLLADLWRFRPSSGEWTWMKGPSTLDASGVHGTQGVEAAANFPGGRTDAVSWLGTDGKLWLFGGRGRASAATVGSLNDLWRYDPATNRWTWMKGANGIDQNGTYGTQGTSAAANTPGGREGAVSWTDSQGRLWLFGGNGRGASGGGGSLNDLWRFDLSTNRWTWIKGSNAINEAGTFGTRGVAAAANKPGARASAAGWSDLSGNLWLFGGGSRNDLWRFDPTTIRWTWMTGDQTSGSLPVFGSLGVPDPANTPGFLNRSGSAVDGLGRFWLFGGFGSTELEDILRNQVWRYDPATNLWTWLFDKPSQGSVYGTKTVPDRSNHPSERMGALVWSDLAGDLWLFGGLGERPSATVAHHNDVWRFAADVAPYVETKPATNVTATGATLNGRFNLNGAVSTVVSQFGLTTAYGSSTTSSVFQGLFLTFNEMIDFNKVVTGLAPHTTYHFRAVATNLHGTVFGADRTFTTVNRLPNAVDDSFAIPATFAATPLAVLANDSDPDLDTLAITILTQPAHGVVQTVAISGGGTGVSYRLTDFDFVGPESFTYRVSDGYGGNDSATVTVQVPTRPDTDRDGFSDAVEALFGTDPSNGGSKPRIAAARSGNNLLITFPSVAGQRYRIEYSSRLNSPDWQTLSIVTAGPGLIEVIDSSASGEPQRFYRVAPIL